MKEHNTWMMVIGIVGLFIFGLSVSMAEKSLPGFVITIFSLVTFIGITNHIGSL